LPREGGLVLEQGYREGLQIAIKKGFAGIKKNPAVYLNGSIESSNNHFAYARAK
jgi:hypothetical protein